MTTVTFHRQSDVDDCLLKFAVVAARYRGKWIFCRHKLRSTWEIPGGHREKGEDITDAAKRELYEETGAVDFSITPVCAYCVQSEGGISYGMLFTAEVKTLGGLPEHMEMAELTFCDQLPDKLTYPLIQPYLFERVMNPDMPDIIPLTISPIDETVRELVTSFLIKEWNSTDMLIRGEVIDMRRIEGFVLLNHSKSAIEGLVTYIIWEDYCEIVSLNSSTCHRGIGTALLEKVKQAALRLGCTSLKLLTTNDNLNAIGFYQKRGFALVGVNLGAIDKERKDNPKIPLIGQNGIPLHHEVDFAMALK